MQYTVFLCVLSLFLCKTNAEKCACLHWSEVKETRCLELHFFEKLLQNISISDLEVTLISIEEKTVCTNITEENRGGWGGSIDVTKNQDGSSSVGGSIKTPIFSVSGHVHTSPNGHVTGGDGGVSVGNGLVSGGVHGGYDKGKGASGGVHASVGLPGLSVGGSVDVNSHGKLSGGASANVGSTSLGATVDGHGVSTSVGSSSAFGKRNYDDDFNIEHIHSPQWYITAIEKEAEDGFSLGSHGLEYSSGNTKVTVGGSGITVDHNSVSVNGHIGLGGAGVSVTNQLNKDTTLHGNLDINSQGKPSFGVGINMKFGRRNSNQPLVK